jgi:hypothetical protein
VIDSSIAAAFEPYLRSGERIVWTGRPGQGVRFTRQDLFVVPFTLLWTGFAIFWTVTATIQGPTGFFTLWGMMFVAFGLYLCGGRLLHDAWVRARTVYALTDERALVLRRIVGERLLSAGLGQVDLTRGRGGGGTIEFTGKGSSSPWGSSRFSWVPSLGDAVRFFKIPDVMTVYALAQRQTGSRPTP